MMCFEMCCWSIKLLRPFLPLGFDSPIAFNAVGESHNEGTFHGSFVCLMNTSFNHENGCVSEYIFFLFWPYNHFFQFCRYLSRSPNK